MTWCQVINNYLCDSKDELCPVWFCLKERFRMTTQFPAYWDLSTLWGAKHDVNSARTVNLMLLGDDNGKRRPSSAHIVQGLRQWHLCVEEGQVHYHAQIPHLPPHWLRVLPTTKQSSSLTSQSHTETETLALAPSPPSQIRFSDYLPSLMTFTRTVLKQSHYSNIKALILIWISHFSSTEKLQIKP